MPLSPIASGWVVVMAATAIGAAALHGRWWSWQHWFSAPKGWPVTFSFGVVTFPVALDSTEEMIKRADEFMYEAKRGGKSAVVSRVIETVAREGD